MIPINNSDTAWLIVSDYNQDNDLPFDALREDVLNPTVDSWTYESRNVGVGFDVAEVGSYMEYSLRVGEVGDDDEAGVGGLCSKTVGFYDENYVGGNPYDPHQ